MKKNNEKLKDIVITILLLVITTLVIVGVKNTSSNYNKNKTYKLIESLEKQGSKKESFVFIDKFDNLNIIHIIDY